MTELGTVLGALMSSLIKARRIADEQTVILAEYYKDNPILEGLSIPRIRIPEVTIDMPMLFEKYLDEERSEMENSKVLVDEAVKQLEDSFFKYKVKINQNFYKDFANELEKRLKVIADKNLTIMKEMILRVIQSTYFYVLAKTDINIDIKLNELIIKDLCNKISKICIIKNGIAPVILANIKTADIKDKSSAINAVRLKITLKEEGLEWATHMNVDGELVNKLQLE